MLKKFLCVLIFMSVIVPAYALENNYDVIIAGAGTGGIAAAFQASSMGMDVLIIEPSSMIGGQAIAAGVKPSPLLFLTDQLRDRWILIG